MEEAVVYDGASGTWRILNLKTGRLQAGIYRKREEAVEEVGDDSIPWKPLVPAKESNVCTYVIWKNQEDRNVANVNEVVGLFEGTYEEADTLIEKLNAGDESVRPGLWGRVYYGYWRSEPTRITLNNYKEFLPQ
jgi:hypothetical protein